jgi:multiple sugar transport system substrate-binding protein
MLKKIIPLMLLAACLAAGCQTKSAVQPAPEPAIATAEEEQTRFTGTLRVGRHAYQWKSKPYVPGAYSWADQTLQERTQQFMEKHPGVEIEFIDVAYDRNFETVFTDPDIKPDIIELTAFEARLVRDRLEDLTPRIEAETGWQGDYLNMIDLARVDGDAVLLPITSNPLVVFYKPYEFRAAGVPEPEDGWTLETFAEIGRLMDRAGHTPGPASRLQDIEPFIFAFGGRFTDDDGRLAGAFDSEETVQAFIRYGELLGSMTDSGLPPYGSGALYIDRAAGYSATNKENAVAPLPVMPDGKRRNNALMTGYAILKDSRQQELAWEYMRFLLGETDDEALDNIVMYTMERSGETLNFRQGQEEPPVFGDTLRWMKHEIAHSPPAVFDLVWYAEFRFGLEPKREISQLHGYADPGTARADIPVWAAELQSYIDTLKAP